VLNFILACLISFLAGSFPSGFVIGKLVKGIDIRQHGSGNVGATNVFRVVGKRWGGLVLFLDALKGWLSVTVIASLFLSGEPSFSGLLWRLVAGFAAIAGHNWTPFLAFKGGKGVATSLGVALGLFPKAASCALASWALVLALSGYVSLASILAAFSFPAWMFLFYRAAAGAPILFGLSILLALLILYTHRSNLGRLWAGKEHRIWKK